MNRFTNKIVVVVLSAFALTNTASAQPSREDGYREMEKRNDDWNKDRDNNRYEQFDRNPDQQGYYYYPDADIYYNPRDRHYCYNDGRGWLNVSILPFSISLDMMPRVMVYSSGPQIWKGYYKHRALFYKNRNHFYGSPIAYRDSRNDWDRHGYDRHGDGWNRYDRRRH